MVAAPCARREGGWEELSTETPADKSWAEAGAAGLHSAFAFLIQTSEKLSAKHEENKV